MNERLNDKLTDFSMMLEGFVRGSADLTPTPMERDRILSNWYELERIIENNQDDGK